MNRDAKSAVATSLIRITSNEMLSSRNLRTWTLKPTQTSHMFRILCPSLRDAKNYTPAALQNGKPRRDDLTNLHENSLHIHFK